MFPRYFSGEITNWPRLPCYSLCKKVVFRLPTPFSSPIQIAGDLARQISGGLVE